MPVEGKSAEDALGATIKHIKSIGGRDFIRTADDIRTGVVKNHIDVITIASDGGSDQKCQRELLYFHTAEETTILFFDTDSMEHSPHLCTKEQLKLADVFFKKMIGQ